MIRDSDDTLRQLGDRLDWIYPVEPSDSMLAVISPLFVRDATAAETPAAPPRPIRPALRRQRGR